MRTVRAELVRTLTTVPMDPAQQTDRELMAHLRDLKADKGELIALCEETARMSRELQAIKASYRRTEIDFEARKARIKDLMLYHGLSQIGDIVMRVQNRASYDYARAEKDGIDLSPYRTVTEVATITVRNPKGGRRWPGTIRRRRYGRGAWTSLWPR